MTNSGTRITKHRAVAAAVLSCSAAALVAVAGVGSPQAAAAPGQGAATRTAPNADLAFARLMGDPENYEIWTMGRDGRHQRRLTWNSVADHDPAWSPDGERIAWTRYSNRVNVGPSDIWVMNADGSDKIRLTRTGAAEHPTWSPDGDRIAFESGYRIWVMDADGTDPQPVSPAGAFDFDPDWSPDGELLAFSSTSDGPDAFDLYVMRPDGTGRTRLAATRGTDDHGAAWSPDGRRIAYSANKRKDDVGWHVSAMRADGTGHHIVVDEYSLGPAWAPGGRKLAFYACSPVGCGLHTSTFRGESVTPLGFRGNSDVQPDYRPRPR